MYNRNVWFQNCFSNFRSECFWHSSTLPYAIDRCKTWRAMGPGCTCIPNSLEGLRKLNPSIAFTDTILQGTLLASHPSVVFHAWISKLCKNATTIGQKKASSSVRCERFHRICNWSTLALVTVNCCYHQSSSDDHAFPNLQQCLWCESSMLFFSLQQHHACMVQS